MAAVDLDFQMQAVMAQQHRRGLLAADKADELARIRQRCIAAKRIALRMAVLAQVHVISHQFASAAKQFERADKLWGIESRLAEASGNQQRGGTQNEIERISTETSAIAAELRRFQTYAQMQSAYGKLQSTLGADPVPERVASQSLDGLSGAIVLAMPPVVKADAVPVAAPAVIETVTPDTPAPKPEHQDAMAWLGTFISNGLAKPAEAAPVAAPEPERKDSLGDGLAWLGGKISRLADRVSE
ncbi:Outer membrane protein (fragment) [Magnetospirillum sp. XM-1]